MIKNTKDPNVLEKLSYASGDAASNLFWMFIVFYANNKALLAIGKLFIWFSQCVLQLNIKAPCACLSAI